MDASAKVHMTRRRVIGFDRELKLEWLDAVASRVAAGDSASQARTWLDSHLGDLLGGNGRSGHRGKTVTVLSRIWASVPPNRSGLRDRAVGLLAAGDLVDRVGIHWAMSIAAYPFFVEVAEVVGRLLVLQGEVDRQAVVRRMLEVWGDRPAVSRGSRAVWTSITNWGVLCETERRGRYAQLSSPLSISGDVSRLLSDSLAHTGGGAAPSYRGAQAPALFPFAIQCSPHARVGSA